MTPRICALQITALAAAALFPAVVAGIQSPVEEGFTRCSTART